MKSIYGSVETTPETSRSCQLERHLRNWCVHFVRIAAKNKLPARFPKVTVLRVIRLCHLCVRILRVLTNYPVHRNAPPRDDALPPRHRHDHHVTRQQFLSRQHNPSQIDCQATNSLCAKDTHITSPTGKTNPPRTLTRPGLEAFRPGEPP
jgi:hypothetical protein